MRLPASLEALDRPIGLPPSLLRKAEEVRLENGPERIEQALDNLDNLAQRNRAALDQASVCQYFRLYLMTTYRFLT